MVELGLDFLMLQAQFAERVSAVSDVTLERALFDYTSLPIRFGAPFGDLVDTHPDWQAFLTVLRERGDLATAIAAAHDAARRSLLGLFPTRPQFGCFSFEYRPKRGIVRPHFANHDRSVGGPLDAARVAVRRAELTAMFRDVKAHYPQARGVVGRSWLYNLEAYWRLFPPAFTERLVPLPNDYHSLGLWGQFVNRHGQVRPELAAQFREQIAASGDLDQLAAAFPLPMLRASSSIGAFYRHYGVT